MSGDGLEIDGPSILVAEVRSVLKNFRVGLFEKMGGKGVFMSHNRYVTIRKRSSKHKQRQQRLQRSLVELGQRWQKNPTKYFDVMKKTWDINHLVEDDADLDIHAILEGTVRNLVKLAERCEKNPMKYFDGMNKTWDINRLLEDVADFRIKAILTMTGADGYWNSCLDHMDIALTYGITLTLFWKGDEMLPQLFQ